MARKTWMALAIATLLGAGALAQDRAMIRVNVPFDFVVRDETLPAGEYTVARGPIEGALTITDRDGRTAVNIVCFPAGRKTTELANALVFAQIGDQHFLREVWADAWPAGAQLPRTKQERQLASSGSITKKVAAAVVR